MTSSQDVYEIRPRKDRRGFDLIGDRLPLGLLWFEGPDAMGDAVNYARVFSRSHPAIIRVFHQSGAVADTLQFPGDYCHNNQNERCVFLKAPLNVHANVSDFNDNQSRFTAEHVRSTGPAPLKSKPKGHNAKLCPVVIRERIINGLAAGDSKAQIARALRVSRHTVSAVAEQEWRTVEQRKARIAAQAERAATRAFDRINQKLDSQDDIPLTLLVPVAGVSVDKLIALRGDASIIARIDHIPTGNIFEQFRRFHEEVLKSIGAKADEPATDRLALPNGQAGSHS
jgi:hypothetical protein